MRLLLASEPRPTAVFAASDEMAVGAVHAVREARLRVRHDVSIIGIDDHEMAEFFDLSTVAQPVHEQGRLAAQLLLEVLATDRESPVEPSAVTVPTRWSCGARPVPRLPRGRPPRRGPKTAARRRTP